MDNKNHREDDYLAMNKYQNHPASNQFPGFGIFEDDGKFYFVMHDNNGNAFMRSEGYSTESGRENGIDSVIKNREIEERWSIEEQRNHFFLCLKAANHKEIAKSGVYDSLAAAKVALAAWLNASSSSGASSAGIGAAAITGKIISENRTVISETRNELELGKVLEENRKVISEERKILGEKRRQIGENRKVINETRNFLSSRRAGSKEDDYLKCDAYKGHKVTDSKNNIAFFQAEGQEYFVVYNKDGSVRLRSEGFTELKNRDQELQAVIKHLNDSQQYTTIKKGKYFINVLKDENGKEIGRSCASTSAGYAVAYVAPVIAAASLAKKEEVKAAAAAPYILSADGCLKLWWIPLLFLLIPILFHLKGCLIDTPADIDPIPPSPITDSLAPAPITDSLAPAPITDSIAIPPVIDTIIPPPRFPVCKCAELTNPVFKIPSGVEPKTTFEVGRAPEYGSIQNLDENGFYNMLNAKFQSSQREKNFLNGIFKQMGYENGWADATAELISSVQLTKGSIGNLGTKASHQTVYRKLDLTNSRDLMAFKIKANNACHLHFLKACGNHFFYEDCE